MAKVNWINGSIEPPDAERCYVIAEALTDYGALKKGDIVIDSDLWTGSQWGYYYGIFRVLSWARRLYPDIPKDLQGRVKWYFGKEVKNDGTISK